MKVKYFFLFLCLFFACTSAKKEKPLQNPAHRPPLQAMLNRFEREKAAGKALAVADRQYEREKTFTSDTLLLTSLRYYKTREYSPELARIYFYLGLYYEGKHRPEKALEAYTLSKEKLPFRDSSFPRKTLEKKLMEQRKQIGEPIAENLQWRYRYEDILEKAKELQSQTRAWQILCLVLSVLLLSIAGVSRYRSVRRRRELFRSQLFIERLQRAEEELKEKLTRELNEKDNKLKDFFRLRVEMIKEFVELSRKYSNNLEKLKDKFSQMVSTDSFSSEDWNLLQEGVNITGYGIVDHLRNTYPELTEENLRYCALICAGFETDELAILWGINNDSIYKRRTRLRQKLGLEKTQDLKKFFDELIRKLR